MKRFVFALTGAAALALAACSSNNQDTVENAEMNQPESDLNAVSNEGANDAEAAALGAQQEQLEQENTTAADNTVNPEDAEQQNVSGM